jgi:transposase
MRSLLFEAAQCLVFRSSRALALKAWFEALAARVGRKKALVALARKLAVILHAMLVHGRDFDENLQATAAAAA